MVLKMTTTPLLAMILLLGGCAHFEYDLTSPADLSRHIGFKEDEVIQRIMLEPMPKKVFITFAEIAAAIEFLISPLARNVTAQAIAIDGGWTAK